ncbi:hypothetical protein GN958_ATG03172 [Phytophthora infestans]|uniref:Uncharacterized protein n=1 Tax=Phytophthora infestans TaxID=4787 RepID=A0A8S9TJ70_PHYIN|nr:hypothetical protein GN958_ATG21913 [Phytophthora infestans]KAF4147637.1 hypothetical protein GN958_ATG03172 [Phytophthora infestans]
MDGFPATERVKPPVWGSQMLSNHLEFLMVGGGDLSSKCGAFHQLYNALVQQGFLERYPFFDELLDIYEDMIFSPSSRATVVIAQGHTSDPHDAEDLSW